MAFQIIEKKIIAFSNILLEIKTSLTPPPSTILNSCFSHGLSGQGANTTKVNDTRIGGWAFARYCQVAITTLNNIALTCKTWSQTWVTTGPQTPIAYFCAGCYNDWTFYFDCVVSHEHSFFYTLFIYLQFYHDNYCKYNKYTLYQKQFVRH